MAVHIVISTKDAKVNDIDTLLKRLAIDVSMNRGLAMGDGGCSSNGDGQKVKNVTRVQKNRQVVYFFCVHNMYNYRFRTAPHSDLNDGTPSPQCT